MSFKNIPKIFFLKGFLSFIATCFPFNFLRIFFLNLIPGFKINDCKIGFCNLFLNNQIILQNSKVGNLNIILVNQIVCKNKSIIGSYNKITSKLPNSILLMEQSQISFKNNFYLSKKTIIGKNVVFGGMNSKIFYNKSSNKDTIFKENLFIGSNCIFLSGIKIEKNIIIGAGSVVLNNLMEPGLYYSKKLTKNEN